MTHRLLKSWEETERFLSRSAVYVESTPFHGEYSEFIRHNELELALDVLIAAGEEVYLPTEYWCNLQRAAEVMGLERQCKTIRERLQGNNHGDV